MKLAGCINWTTSRPTTNRPITSFGSETKHLLTPPSETGSPCLPQKSRKSIGVGVLGGPVKSLFADPEKYDRLKKYKWRRSDSEFFQNGSVLSVYTNDLIK